MRRYADLYAQLAADRDHDARRAADLVLQGEWDRAAVAAKKYQALQARLDAMLIGSFRTDE